MPQEKDTDEVTFDGSVAAVPAGSAPITPDRWLRRALDDAHCTRAGLARKIGRTREEVTRWASGREQIPRAHLGEIASSLCGPDEIDYVLRLKDCEDYTDRLVREADRFAKLAHTTRDVVVDEMLRSMDATMKSVYLDKSAQAVEWLGNLIAAIFVLRTWSDFLRDGTTKKNLIDVENVSRHLQYPVNLFFGTLLGVPGQDNKASVSRAVGLTELRRLVSGADEAQAVPLIRQHALHLLGRYGDQADRAMVADIITGGIRSTDALSRKLGYCGLMMSPENGREAADEFVYHLSRDTELADIDLAFDATHYRDLSLDDDRTLKRPIAGMVNLATNIAKHYENPGRYAQLADADAFRMMKIIEMGGLAPLGPAVSQMFEACIKGDLIPKDGGTFTRLLRSTLSTELAGQPRLPGQRLAASSLVLPNNGKVTVPPTRDAFLAYRSSDLPTVRKIAVELKKLQIQCWFDLDDLVPGQVVQEALEEALRCCRTTVVFVGPAGLGPWEKFEYRHSLHEAARMGRPVIPVILEGEDFPDGTPPFLQQFHAVIASRFAGPGAVAARIEAGVRAARVHLNG